MIRGIRGATNTEENDAEQILFATRELLEEICRRNDLEPADIASVFFTLTPDLNATFPAGAARQLGWTMVPLMCFQEIRVESDLERCIRVLILLNTDKPQDEIHHVYLRQASSLRPDWSGRRG